ncbi:ankyrin repeat domain-containing protein [Legionella antarctica]|nr:ankyrin repeat domain-containing protein [Legionella antarctica]
MSDPLVDLWHWIIRKEASFPKDSTNPIVIQKLEETIRALIQMIRIQKLVPLETKLAPSAASSSIKDIDNCLAFLNYCQTTLQSNRNETAYSLALRYFVEKEQATVWPEEKINAVFSHYLEQNKEDALELYTTHEDYFNEHTPGMKNIISNIEVTLELERFRELLRLENNLLGIIPLSTQLFAEPNQLAAFLLLLLERGISTEELIESHVLHTFLAYHITSLCSPESEIKQLYKVLGWYKTDELITQAHTTTASIANYHVAYSLTGEQQDISPPAPNALESSVTFTIDEQNFRNLHALFGDAFLTTALQFFRTNKNEGLAGLLRQTFDELMLKQTAQFINNTATTNPAWLETLAELLNAPLVIKLIDARFGAIFYLARYKPEVFARINDISALKAYIEDLLKSDTSIYEQLNQLTNLLQTFINNQGNKEAQALLYTSILDITLDNTRLHDSSIINFLSKNAGSYKELIRQRAQDFFDLLFNTIKNSTLLTNASKDVFIEVEDCWKENNSKFALLRAIDDQLSSSFPSDIYALYGFIVDMAVKKDGNFNLSQLLQSLLPPTIEPSNDEISMHERALFELMATIDDVSVREQCIVLLETTPRKQGQWLNTEYGGESVVSRAAAAGNVSAIHKFLEIGSIDSSIVSQALKTAAKDGYWNIVRSFCAMTTDSKPNREVVYEALKQASKSKDWDIVQFLCTMATDNKPDSEAVGEALDQASRTGHWDIVQFLGAISTDNKAYRMAVELALWEAARVGKWNVVQFLCDLTTSNKPDWNLVRFLRAMTTYNKPDSKAVGGALMQAAANGPLDIIQLLYTVITDNKPSSITVSSILKEASTTGHWDIVQFLCAMTMYKKPDSEAVGTALMQAVAHDRLDIVQSICTMVWDNKPTSKIVGKALKQAIIIGRLNIVQFFCAMTTDNKPDGKIVDEAEQTKLLFSLQDQITKYKINGQNLTDIHPKSYDGKRAIETADKLTQLTCSLFYQHSNAQEYKRLRKSFALTLNQAYDRMGSHGETEKTILDSVTKAATEASVIRRPLLTGTGFFKQTEIRTLEKSVNYLSLSPE